MQQDDTGENQAEQKEVQPETPEQPAEESQGETKEETAEDKLAKAEAEAAKWRRLFEKASKPSKVEAPSLASTAPVEETVLLAQGMSEELLTELKAVAQVRKTTLIKAQSDPIFVSIKEKYEKDAQTKNASLPASRGSGQMKAQKTFTSPGLTREEHRKMVMESNI
jgi:hypothetical protein